MSQLPSPTPHTPPPPHANNWLDGSYPAPRSGPGWILPMMVGGVLFASGCLGGLVSGFFAGAASNLADSFGSSNFVTDAFDATVTITTPDTITAGVPFDITVSITDTGGRARTLDYVDWKGPMIQRLSVQTISPPPTFTDPSPTLREHGYETRIPALGTTTVTFTVQADEPGPLTLDLNIYLDMTNESHTHTITIHPAADPHESTPPTQTPEQ